jgi:hypothetical protein
MGGSYNTYANYYLITQNDAHVWVEAFENGNWKKIDPTDWVAPERLDLGGAAFMESFGRGAGYSNQFLKIPKFINEIKLWFRQWDFLFYQWLEDMDYHSQSSLLKRLKIRREWLFSIIPLLMVTFMLLYMLFLSFKNKRNTTTIYQEIWKLFYLKMNKRGLKLSTISIESSSELIRNLNDQSITLIWEKLVELSFKETSGSIDELKKMIKKI